MTQMTQTYKVSIQFVDSNYKPVSIKNFDFIDPPVLDAEFSYQGETYWFKEVKKRFVHYQPQDPRELGFVSSGYTAIAINYDDDEPSTT